MIKNFYLEPILQAIEEDPQPSRELAQHLQTAHLDKALSIRSFLS